MAAKSVPSRPAGALTAKKRKLDAVSDGDGEV